MNYTSVSGKVKEQIILETLAGQCFGVVNADLQKKTSSVSECILGILTVDIVWFSFRKAFDAVSSLTNWLSTEVSVQKGGLKTGTSLLCDSQ